MLKNVMIAVLFLVVLVYWIKVDPECMKSDDPNVIVIEYECSNLDEYENVPPEVVEECKDRANEALHHKNNT